MPYEEYLKAQKSGLKSYRLSAAQGHYPYLPVLDDLLSHIEIEGEKSLGLCEIPLDQVVGTCTSGRTTAFAPNFMPLLELGTEFASKWINLVEAQMTEGIRDPIKVYEYKTNFYVLEGNKRVSVLKYLQAPSIMANVIRKVPKYRPDDPVSCIYYEYMEFYALTQICYIRFEKKGRYAKLLNAVGKNQTDIWTDEEKKTFSGLFSRFEKAFKEIKKQKHEPVLISEALLFYLNLYTYETAQTLTAEQFKKDLEKLWPDLVVFGEEDAVAVSLNPDEVKTSVIEKIIPARTRKVAFIYDSGRANTDWAQGHEQGRLHLEEVFGQTIITKAYRAESDSDYDDVLKEACEDGSDVIFTVSPRMMKACLKAAVDYPQVIILNCALYSSHNAVRTYHARSYEAMFLTGMIAGSVCRNNRVGFVANYPLYGAVAGINAFALGVKMVNPYAKVYLAWSTVRDFDIDQYFWAEQVSCIYDQNLSSTHADVSKFSLYEYVDSKRVDLAVPVQNWGAFYERMMRRIIKGGWKKDESGEPKAINYWWGLSAGVVDVICEENLPERTVQLVQLMKQNIASELYYPFTGPLVQQGGIVHYEKDEQMTAKDLMQMDWLVDNIVGHIPTVDELKEEIRPLVMLKGLYAVTASKGGNEIL